MKLPRLPSFLQPQTVIGAELAGQSTSEGEQPASTAPQIVAQLALDLVVRIAEEVWRLERRLNRLARDVGEEPLNGVRDSVTRLKDVLAHNEVEIEEHEGQPYDEGLRLDIVHIEGNPELHQRLWIVETVVPTVRLTGRILSPGKVILGTTPPEGR